MNALQLREIEELPAPEERGRFRVETIDQVNWALRKMAAIKAKKAEIKRLADEEIARIMAWEEAESKKLDGDYQFFERLLSEYAITKREADPSFKKESTPYGAVKFVKQKPKWHYDDAKLLESLKSAGRSDLIRINEEPNKADLRKIATVVDGKVIDPESGAILDGVMVEELPDTVVVEVEA
jgi:hypothetical protein